MLAIPAGGDNARHNRLPSPKIAPGQAAGGERSGRPGERRTVGDSAPIRVVLIDDHPVVLAGLQKYLELAGDIIVSGTATDGAEALALIAGLHPDVLVLDVVLRDISGLLVAHDVRRLHPEVAVLMLTADEELSDREELLRIGVHGCLSKAQPGHQIAAAVRVAANGGTLLDSLVPPTQLLHERPGYLTTRELEVLHLIERGHRNHEIARILSISPYTVESHVHHVLDKLGARSRTEAVIKALQQHSLPLFSAQI